MPVYGKGKSHHDYGAGFYTTESLQLAKEWAVANPDQSNGWVHEYKLDETDLKILDFEEVGILPWIAELMKHRDADSSRRYKVLSAKFIDRYGIDTDGYDVIKGWRADASYFYITKAFVRDEVDLDIMEELFKLGGLGIQYCLKSEKAFAALQEVKDKTIEVPYDEYNPQYSARDLKARKDMKDLINSDRNTMQKVFSTLI